MVDRHEGIEEDVAVGIIVGEHEGLNEDLEDGFAETELGEVVGYIEG